MLVLRKWDYKDWLALILGLVMVVRIRVVGTFLLSELILLAMFPFTGHVPRKSGLVKKLHLFSILWLIGTVISNIENEIDIIDFVKGVFFLVVMILIIRPLYWLLVDKPERYILIIFGMGLTSILSPLFAQNEEVAQTWKMEIFIFYYIFAFFSGLASVLFFKGRRVLSLLIIEAASIIGLFYGSRNLFLTTTVSCVLLYIIINNKSDITKQVLLFRHRLIRLSMTMFLALLLIDFTYEYMAKSRILGDAAYSKYMNQIDAGGNVLKGGRIHFFMGIELIKMKPIVGWGSYAKDDWGFSKQYFEDNDIPGAGDTGNDTLPAHSAIVGAWMQNGILGGLFWFFILFIVFKIFRSGCFLYENRLLGILVFGLFSQLWDWFFSPLGNRITFISYILVLIIIYNNYQRNLYPYSKNKIKQLYL